MNDNKKKCFVIMPFTLKDIDLQKYKDQNHWTEVYEGLIKSALKDADVLCDRYDSDIGSRLIVENILEKIENSDLILCDLSSNNPNVFLDLVLALRSDKPYILIKDDLTTYNFDLYQNYTFTYTHTLQPTIVSNEIKKLSNVIKSTLDDEARRYSLIDRLSISYSAIEKIKEGDVNTSLLVEITNILKNIKGGGKQGMTITGEFPWPKLLKETTYYLHKINKIIENIDSIEKVRPSLLREATMELGINKNANFQVSIINDRREYIYHDWENLIGGHASCQGNQQEDIYDEIEKHDYGAVAWIDYTSNISKSLPPSHIRYNVALYYKTKLDLKIIIETHYETSKASIL